MSRPGFRACGRTQLLVSAAVLCVCLSALGVADEPKAATATRIDTGRLQADLKRLSEIGRDPAGGVTRLGLSQAELDAHTYAIGLMKEAGLTVRTDAAGNVFGRREGTEQLPVLWPGNQIDFYSDPHPSRNVDTRPNILTWKE